MSLAVQSARACVVNQRTNVVDNNKYASNSTYASEIVLELVSIAVYSVRELRDNLG